MSSALNLILPIALTAFAFYVSHAIRRRVFLKLLIDDSESAEARVILQNREQKDITGGIEITITLGEFLTPYEAEQSVVVQAGPEEKIFAYLAKPGNKVILGTNRLPSFDTWVIRLHHPSVAREIDVKVEELEPLLTKVNPSKANVSIETPLSDPRERRWISLTIFTAAMLIIYTSSTYLFDLSPFESRNLLIDTAALAILCACGVLFPILGSKERYPIVEGHVKRRKPTWLDTREEFTTYL